MGILCQALAMPEIDCLAPNNVPGQTIRRKTLELKPSIYYCGVQDPNLRVFDIIMNTPYGTSYNSFVIKGDEKTALIEATKSPFWEEYLAKVKAITPIEKIDYLIVNHTEPDHAGAIAELIKLNPNITVVGTNSAIQFAQQIANISFQTKVVKAGDTIDLGNRVLSFHPMPNLHWPDTMFTLETKENVLFTCDCFGAHYSFEPVLMSKMADKTAYFKAQQQYYEDIMSPFSIPFVANGTKFARSVNPTMICTGHGPILDSDIEQTFEKYEACCAQAKKDKKSIVVAYVSAYGYTRKLAETIVETIKAHQDVDVSKFEITDQNMQEATEAILAADGFLLGTPTILGDALRPMMELTLSIHPILVRGKIASAFGSYGWSGEGVPNIMARLDQLKLRTLEGFRARFQPNEEDLAEAKKFAENFAQAIIDKK